MDGMAPGRQGLSIGVALWQTLWQGSADSASEGSQIMACGGPLSEQVCLH